MTWVDDQQKEKREQDSKRKEAEIATIKQRQQDFKLAYSLHKHQIISAINEVKNQGLIVQYPKSVTYVELNRGNYEYIKTTLTGFENEPWVFSGTETPNPNTSPCYIWKISYPESENICLHMCFANNQIIFRSGYKISKAGYYIPHRSSNIFDTPKMKNASKYGLTKEVTFFQRLGYYNHHVVGQLPVDVKDSYGETTLGEGTAFAIVSEHIINTVHDWFKFASKDI